jgi:histidyl-tRNA synthetase
MAVSRARGMRDLLPEDMIPRLAVFDTVRAVFKRHGFDPLQTPALERIETLTGKYGDEGSQLIFRVLKRGEAGERGEVGLGLRYDLTVPLARVIAMHPQLQMPFKRYQIQPVWRADRPQRGRFREFTQCDVDIVGTESRLAEAECLNVVNAALSELGFDDFTMRLNDRRLLKAMADAVGAGDREVAIIVTLDKLDKIGRDRVRAELTGSVGLDDAAADSLFAMLDGAPIPGMEEVEAELVQIRDWAAAMGTPPERIRIDRSLARGLDYYTGPVFETVLNDGSIGSVSGGGRYDGLVGMFSGRPVPAVGVSLGIDRLLVMMSERGLLPEKATNSQVWVTVFSAETMGASLETARAFREAGLATEVTMDRVGKIGKQLRSADRRGVRWAVVIGPDEAAAGAIQLKDLRGDFKEVLSLADAIAHIQAEG